MNKHELFMKLALELAEKGCGAANPNPMVGAVLVKNGKIIGGAYHKRVGGLHAEALALKKAGKNAKGAELYINLEPCSHVGRTPPCTDAIIKSGIKKVYCAMKDPNRLNNGRGIKILTKNGIDVSIGLLNGWAKELNEVFIKYITKGMPFVTLKTAESLDGKIATKKYDSKWITSELSRDYVHRLRSEADAILVGVNTIIKDNPLLTSRRNRSPIKVVLDPYLNVPETANIFSKKSPSLNIIAVLKDVLNKKAVIEKIRRLSKKGIMVIGCCNKAGRIDLAKLLKELAELEIAHLLVEGGGDTAAGFIEAGLVDRVLFFIAPKIIGGRDAVTSIEGLGVDKVKKAVKLRRVKVEAVGEDILVKADVYGNN
ncbi:MAG: bifunctional diaminohydroxyphosphoribosylaminopyrimidine deaminase/5-amino-6-(5-phosphoribosylamino)uracil reductase RibD [Candidatus Omnitrophica bacterium]|nr:bifunctional diaminohydroxyphosphoribosylaminopyrimidine deaminase/5-amino-6-(5-phosphoribosylamino)uracil reductase RibD [Candidatus Omnitrophota bacterium]